VFVGKKRKIVLVTGGTGAIGSEIVRALGSDFSVVANFARDEQRAAQLQRETPCDLHRADIGNEAEVEAMFAAWSEVWAVVHAAGIARNEILLRQSNEMWQETLRVNATGSFLVTRAALNRLPHRGRLILLASRVGEWGSAGQCAYAASKAAVIALAKTAAREGGERHIAVNAVCPGLVPSVLTETLGEDALQKFRSRSVFGELGLASHTASAVRWLLSAESEGVSGQVVHCDSRI
jgi:3-oxoacyl-[acyl-carrier protein] reductase